MKVSTRGRYGLRILLDIAMNQDKGPASVSDISSRQDISVKYLDQLIQPLRKAALIDSVRGPKGGYLLSRAPQDITLGEVLTIMEGDICLVDCVSDPKNCDRSLECRMRQVWEEAAQAVRDTLDSLSLASLMEEPSSESCSNKNLSKEAWDSESQKDVDAA